MKSIASCFHWLVVTQNFRYCPAFCVGFNHLAFKNFSSFQQAGLLCFELWKTLCLRRPADSQQTIHMQAGRKIDKQADMRNYVSLIRRQVHTMKLFFKSNVCNINSASFRYLYRRLII